jgi:hypothetical protein
MERERTTTKTKKKAIYISVRQIFGSVCACAYNVYKTEREGKENAALMMRMTMMLARMEKYFGKKFFYFYFLFKFS